MKYVFLDIATSGLDYKNDELIYINLIKCDQNCNELEKKDIYIKPQNKITEEVQKLTKISNETLDKGVSLELALKRVKKFIDGCYIITFNSAFDLSFLLTAMYQTKIDMTFWYIDLLKFFREHDTFKNKKISFNLEYNKYIKLMKKYIEINNTNLNELVKVRPKNWNSIFRGINYSEYLGDYPKYSFYLVDLTSDKYPSYLACLKEIRCENFTLEEIKNLKNNYNIKILVHITKINDETLKITNDYYIASYYNTIINPNEKWGKDYINELQKAGHYIKKHNDIEITCYNSLKELEEKTKFIDKSIMDIIKSKIVREKKKWSRWN